MEVSGKKKDTQENRRLPGTSVGPLCQPCSADSEDLDADGFCEHCQEYLCGTCVRYHKKATLSKHHVILDKEKMPRNFVPQTTKQLCTETCSKHAPEIIKFFCKDHDTTECGICIVLDHKSCSVDFIQDIVGDFENGPEFSQLLDRIGLLRSNVASSKEELEQRKTTVAEANGKAIEDIRSFRKEIELYFNKIEDPLMEECEQLQKKNQESIKKTDHNLAAHEKELDKLYDRLTNLSVKANTGDLFVHAKQTNARLDELDREIKRGNKLVLTKFKFERNKDLDDMLLLKSTFGKLIYIRNPLSLQKLWREFVMKM